MRRIERRLSASVDRWLLFLRRLIEPVRVRFERVPRDAWVGVFWARRTEVVESVREKRGWFQHGTFRVERPIRQTTLVERDRLDVWVCLVPCLPLHVSWRGPPRQRTPAWLAANTAEPCVPENAPEPEARPARTAVFAN